MKDKDRYFGDVAYEVWRHGGNPDTIDDDRIEESRLYGDEYDFAAKRELRHQRSNEEPT